MNCQHIAIGIAAITAFSTIALSQPSHAVPVVIRENPDFDTMNNIPKVGLAIRSPIIFEGRVQPKTDRIDVIKFVVAPRVTTVRMQLLSNNSRTLYRVYEDSDRNGQLNVGDHSLHGQRPSGSIITVPVTPGKVYLAQVLHFRDTPEAFYGLTIGYVP
jgi:hypothetical protein